MLHKGDLVLIFLMCKKNKILITTGKYQAQIKKCNCKNLQVRFLSSVQHLPSKQTVSGSNPDALTKEKSEMASLFFVLKSKNNQNLC